MKRKNTNIFRKSTPGYASRMADSLVIYSSSAGVSALPTPKFLEWVRSLPGKEEFSPLDFEARCYMVPDCDGNEACEEWLLANIQQIFQEECREFTRSARLWPQLTRREMIWEYFHFIYYTRMIHLGRKNTLN